ncbi:MAG: hypothetical protein OK422_06055 [Thaumarchaeota archaeon]|nr:hypothetical protein [Nitrososphaerota archaeon]
MGAKRGRKFKKIVQGGAEDFSVAANEMLAKGALPLVAKVLFLAIVQALLSGVALWIVLTSAGLKIDLLSSTATVCAVIAIAAVPVSIGRSGIAELGVQYYLLSVYGFTSWAAVVMWRIASFQVVLALCGIAFLLFVHRATRGHLQRSP